MSEPRDARDVIAHMLYRFDLKWFRVNDSTYEGDADAILAALADAGYAVVRKGGPDDRYEQGYTDGGNSKLADVILFFDEVFEVEPVGYDLNARIVKELEERF